MNIFRKGFFKQPFAWISILSLLFQIIAPTTSWALTAGPSQPEVQSFEPVTTTQMVDPFSGDFTYNIPLLDCGGYPINISYHAGIGMDQEASWVGLGWNINPGVINRNMRGVPDDFKGDVIEKKTNMKPHVQVGIDPRVAKRIKFGNIDEVFGSPWTVANNVATQNVYKKNSLIEKTEIVQYQIFYNNYKGIGYSIDFDLQKKIGEFRGGLGLGYNSQEGFTISPSLSYKRKQGDNIEKQKKIKFNASVSSGYSSRNGLTSLGIGKGLSKTKETELENDNCDIYYKSNTLGGNINSSYNFQNVTYTPISKPNQFSYNYNIEFKFFDEKSASTNPKSILEKNFTANVSLNGIHNFTNSYNTFGFLNEQFGNEFSLKDFNNEGNNSFNKYTNNLSPSSNTFDILGLSGQGNGGSYKPTKNIYSNFADPKTKISSLSKISIPIELGFTKVKKEMRVTDFEKMISHVELVNPLYGKSVKVGANPSLTYVWGESGLWSDNQNVALNDITSLKTINNLNENVYYKNASEKTVYDKTYFDNLWGDKAARIEINGSNDNANIFENLKTTKKFVNGTDIKEFNEGNLQKKGRAKRSEVIQYLNAEEASKFGIEKNLYSYSYNQYNNVLSPNAPISRMDQSIRKPHHISEIISTTTDGSRYVYGLPVYNAEQYEKTFNVGEKNIGQDYFKHGLTNYDVNNNTNDVSVENKKGVDHFYHEEKMPSYVHSWMLTSVLSSDYVDVTGDGPTPDDLGSYTKFNYQKVNELYSWRFPIGANKANHNRGLKSDKKDDKGSIVHGKKEVWYLQSVETKTHLAIFITSNRQDSYPVNEAGTVLLNSIAKLKKLDRIELYNRNEFYNTNNKIPIKTVHFEYSYDLCPNTLNNDQAYSNLDHPLKNYNSNLYNKNANENKGKLTLHKIWFTYGTNPKGALSPYVFEYKGINPEYAAKSVDRWGNYKPWNYHYNGSFNNNYSYEDHVSNAENPYVPQNETMIDVWAGAWNLTDIKLPSGGKLKVEYEADDYAYVQDKKASQMFKIAALGNNSNTMNNVNTNIHDLYDEASKKFNNYVFIEIPNGTNLSQVFGQNTSFYCSFYVHLNPNDIPYGFQTRKEHIQTYLDIDKDDNGNLDMGTKTVNNKLYAYFKIKHSFLGDNDQNDDKDDIHPVTKQAFQFIRENANFLAYPGYVQNSDESVKSFVGSLFSFIPEFARTIVGHERYMRDKNYASKCELNNSYIKLFNPNGYKKGGGHRVKKITIDDNWNEMTNNLEGNFSTGQEFIYTTNESNNSSTLISSGVASWEPLVGGDENTHRERIKFTKSNDYTQEEKNLLSPNNFRYEEGPIGESLYPSASVGYSKITIKNLKPAGVNPDLLKKHGTGKTVQEFYTAKDFPTLSSRTDLEVHIRKNLALGILGISKEKAVASQGFAVETNDMHGKPKAVLNYTEYDDSKPLNGTKYYYKTTSVGKLQNNVDVLNNKGELLSNQIVGAEIDMFSYSQKNEHNALSGSADINYHAIFPNTGTPPMFPVLTLFSTLSISKSVTNVITTTKVINRFGLIDKVEAIEDGASLMTQNLAWDAESGEVIYTKTQNEYGDFDYSITKPAHWVEEGMGGAYQNIGAEIIVSTIGSNYPGFVVKSNVSNYGGSSEDLKNILYPGDELIPIKKDDDLTITTIVNGAYVNSKFNDLIANSTSNEKYWVLSVSSNGANLIDKNGNVIPQSNLPYYFKIYRSGHRNMLGAPAEQIVSKNPIQGSNWQNTATMSNVLSGSALLYSDNWQTYYQMPPKGCIDCEIAQDPLQVEDYLIDGQTYTTPITQTDYSNIFFKGNDNCVWKNFCSADKYKKPGDVVNPYFIGIRGNWKPWYSMVYYDRTNAQAERSQPTTGADPNTTYTRTAGVINNYVPFYQYSNNNNQWVPQWLPGAADHSQWTWQNRATKIGPQGEEVESENKLGIYSSALYGYQKTLPMAVTGNSKYEDMLFDGFEEYGEGFFTTKCANNGSNTPLITPFPLSNSYMGAMICENNWHWPLWKALANGKARISNQKAHTGKYSLLVNPSGARVYLDNNDGLIGNYSIGSGQFYLSQQDFIPVFSPKNSASSGHLEYLISYWVYGNGNVELKDANGNLLTINQIGNSITIDGWKRYEGKVILPAQQRIDEILFNNLIPNNVNNPQPVLFDDFRILPYMGNMNSYVYNKVNKRLMATLSENNFATFYEYDEEGALIRTKVETEKGIMTVQESRSSLRKK